MKEPEALVFGAELRCENGSVRNYLLTEDYASKGINGLPAKFVVTDCIPGVNIMPFGDCYAGGPCVSQWMLDDKWINSDGQNETFGGKEIITTASHLVCNACGVFILPVNSGQDGVIGEQMLFFAQFDQDLLEVLCDPYGSLYSPNDLTEKAFAFLKAVIVRGGEIDLSKFGKYPLGKVWDSLVGNKTNMVDALTIMAINHLTGIDVTNAYRGPLDYPVATSLMGINGLYGPTASRIFAEQTELDTIPRLIEWSNKRYLNNDTLEAIKSYSAETMEKVNTSGFAKWAQENKATIAGIEQILYGILILVMGKVETKSSLGNTIQYVDNATEGTGSGAKGLVGRNFEDYLTREIGGNGSFSNSGREFDGGVGNRWWEAKSGQYWDILQNNPNELNNFKSSMGQRLSIAQQNGATFELFSNTPIPQSIQNWLTLKGIPFTEILR